MSKLIEKYYNFAVSDFDGTVYRSDGTVSQRTVNAINRFIANGGNFCICTGRPTAAIINYCEKFNLGGYVISYNGAEITDVKTKSKIFSKHVDNSACIKLLEYAEKHGFVVHVYPNDELTVKFASANTLEYSKILNLPFTECGYNVSEKFKRENLTSAKVLFYTNDEIADKMLIDIKLLLGDGYNVIRSNKKHIDVTCGGISKGNAIKILANYLNADMGRLVCFGDEMNDKSMLEVAGLSAVCSSGNPKLMQMADVVIGACDDDGVAIALEKYGI